MLSKCDEKVLRLSEMDCRSPMSAQDLLKNTYVCRGCWNRDCG